MPRFSSVRVPSGLQVRVLEGVRRARSRAYRTRLAGTSAMLLVTAGGSFLMARATVAAAQTSGFLSLANLARTDTSVITAHAHAFGLSLIETLPSIDVAGTVFAFVLFLVSTRSLVRVLASLVSTAGASSTNLTTA